jgi:hypothetical protein
VVFLFINANMAAMRDGRGMSTVQNKIEKFIRFSSSYDNLLLELSV